ncbi:MAG: SMI1/KNR4 family protein [Clostridia bacterium]|nr:SMI1/KNR4 family protein [Clostridia bacterium]
MNANITEFLGGLNFGAPATAGALADIETGLGVKLPRQYLAFMAQSDGAEGYTDEAYLFLWPSREVLALNGAAAEGGLVFFGTDGCGAAYAFDYARGAAVVAVPFNSPKPGRGALCAKSFYEFLIRRSGSRHCLQQTASR